MINKETLSDNESNTEYLMQTELFPFARLLRWHMEITSNLYTLKLPSYSVAVLN
jgi:hypothetical protein